MKITIVCLIASVLLLNNFEQSSGSPCEPEPETSCRPPVTTARTTTHKTTTTKKTTITTKKTTTTTAKPTTTTAKPTTTTAKPTTTTTPRVTTTRTTPTTTKTTTTERPRKPCRTCGPGGVACGGCKDQPELCVDLLSKIKELRKLIEQCVCGANVWVL